MPFSVELFTTTGAEIGPTALTFEVQRYSGHAIGGYEQAEIKVNGPPELLAEVHRWLGYRVRIVNEYRNIVWAGIVTQTMVGRGKRQRTKSLDDMFNRIAVTYTYTDATNTSVDGTTDWADNTNSQYLYGIKEQMQSIGDQASDQADALRDNALLMLGEPIEMIVLGGDGNVGGVLQCKGLWSTTEWRIFNQPGGVEKYEVSGSYDHILGWGLTSDLIGFESSQDRIHDLTGRFKDLRKDDVLIITGAANAGNNGTFTVDQTTSLDAVSYTAGTILFEVTDDIKDLASGLGFVQSNEMLRVTGSAVSGNNRYYFAKDDLQADHITVNPSTVANSGSGPSITIAQGNSISIVGALTTEYPANTVTITALGKAVAQSFTLSVDSPFTVAEVYVRAKKVGSPADNLRCFIEADSGGSPTNVSLESVSVAGSNVQTDMDWVKFSFTNTLSLTYGTTYWLVIDRSGSPDYANYYMVDLSEEAGYTTGTLKLWNNSAWVARSVAADMPFQIWAHRETTTQASDMLTTAGQFFVAQDIQVSSGIYSRQFRNQNRTAKAEIETLLSAGVSGGRRILANVTADRVVQLYQEPIYDSNSAPLLDDNNQILDPTGAPWDIGKLPHGRWLTLMGEVPGDDYVFIERAEYDAVGGTYSALEPKGAPNPWDVVNLT